MYPRPNFTRTFVEETSLEETETLEGLARFLDTKVTPQDYSYSDWVETNNLRVPLSGKQILLGTSENNENVGKYGDFTTDDLQMVNPEFLGTLQTKISEYFDSNGFNPSSLNTDLVPNELYFSTLGYEKNNLKCLASLSVQSDPFGYITCGTVDTSQMKLQNELQNVLEEQKTRNTGTIPLMFRVSQVDGDFANGSIASLGGYQWIAKKINGVWTTIWAGQEAPSCSDMKTYDVPKTMYPGCYNDTTQQFQDSY